MVSVLLPKLVPQPQHCPPPERDRHPLGNLCCGPAVRCHPQTSLLSSTVLSPAHGCRQSRDLPAPAASRPVTPGAGVTAQPCRVHLSTDRTSLKEKPITCIPAGFRIKLHISERKSASPKLGPGTSNCTRTPTASQRRFLLVPVAAGRAWPGCGSPSLSQLFAASLSPLLYYRQSKLLLSEAG